MNWWMVIGISICLLGLVKIWNLRTQMIEQKNQMMNLYLLSVQEFYVAIQDQIEQMRRYRHDLAKHVQILEMLQENNVEQEELKKYSDWLRSEYYAQQEKKARYCHHEIINMILLLKAQQCEKQGIPFTVRVEDEEYESLKNIDWVGLLFNLLDNAIEANERIPVETNFKRGIFLSMKMENENTILEVKNQICPGEKVTFQTNKKKKEFHGIGVQIIDEIVEKYQGMKEVTLDKENSLLTNRIVLRDGLNGDE